MGSLKKMQVIIRNMPQFHSKLRKAKRFKTLKNEQTSYAVRFFQKHFKMTPMGQEGKHAKSTFLMQNF